MSRHSAYLNLFTFEQPLYVLSGGTWDKSCWLKESCFILLLNEGLAGYSTLRSGLFSLSAMEIKFIATSLYIPFSRIFQVSPLYVFMPGRVYLSFTWCPFTALVTDNLLFNPCRHFVSTTPYFSIQKVYF